MSDNIAGMVVGIVLLIACSVAFVIPSKIARAMHDDAARSSSFSAFNQRVWSGPSAALIIRLVAIGGAVLGVAMIVITLPGLLA
jgi:hypothetical protein